MTELINPTMPYHVQVRFGGGIPAEVQSYALLEFERCLREVSGMPCEVFLDTMRDQNKLRRLVTKDDLL